MNQEINKLPWVEKYRPKNIDDIISHGDIIGSLRKFIEKKSLPHLLFFGPSGSGKTSTIKCCAFEIYGDYMDHMILILNASNERGIETVRTKIKNFVCNKNSIFLPTQKRDIFKMVILDEIDSMTVDAQGMLRQTIENHSKTTRFCLICNDIDKINLALQSRCAMYRFSPLQSTNMKKKLEDICENENITYDKKSLNAIIKISKGDMRSAINSLQFISLTMSGDIKIEKVYKLSGYAPPKVNKEILLLLENSYEEKIGLLECINKINFIVTDNNMTIPILLEYLSRKILESEYNIDQKIFFIENFSKIELYDTINVDQKNLIMIIVSLFISSKNLFDNKK